MDLYQQARRGLDELERRERTACAPACRSLVLTRGGRTERSTLFLHGLCASPKQFEAVARSVHAAGDNVFAPRLPHHGDSDRLSDRLKNLQAHELLYYAHSSLSIAAGLGGKVRVVGFSLGGLLALWLAQHYAIDQGIAVAPLLGIAAIPRQLTNTFATVLSRFPNRFFWWDPIRRERQLPAHGYPRCSTHALAESLTIAGLLFRSARQKAPRSRVTLVTNSCEAAVNNRATVQLEKIWRSHKAQIEHLRITGLGVSHDIIEPEREDAKVVKSYPPLCALLNCANPL